MCVLVCVFAQEGDAGVKNKFSVASSQAVITWGGCWWMGHNCAACLAPSL